MFISKKVKQVLAGKELLRIESQHQQIPKETIHRQILSSSIIYIAVLIFAWWFYWGEFIPLCAFSLFVTMIYMMTFAFLSYYLGNKGNPLSITDKGVALPNSAANFWDEIESYGWEEYKGLNKVPGPTVFSASEGVCLKINPKSFFFSYWAGRGGNIMTTWLIFFSPEQIVEAEQIFLKHSVPKMS